MLVAWEFAAIGAVEHKIGKQRKGGKKEPHEFPSEDNLHVVHRQTKIGFANIYYFHDFSFIGS